MGMFQILIRQQLDASNQTLKMDIPDGSSYAPTIGLHPHQQNEQQGKEQSDPAITPRKPSGRFQLVKYLSFNVYSQLLHTSLLHVWAAYSPLPKCPPQIKAGTLPRASILWQIHHTASSFLQLLFSCAWFASIQISAWQHSSNTSSMKQEHIRKRKEIVWNPENFSRLGFYEPREQIYGIKISPDSGTRYISFHLSTTFLNSQNNRIPLQKNVLSPFLI